MFYRCIRRAALLGLAAAASSTLAAAITFSGNLGDAANASLVASDLSAALFSDDLVQANNVALYALHVPLGGSVSFASTGYAGGGVDPYFTLFSGTDRASATFYSSNYLHALTVGGDFTMAEVLNAGDYTVAIGAFENLSFAENGGSGFLADGFIGLGGPGFFGDGSYVLTVTLPITGGTVPEPDGAMLTLTALWAAVWAGRRRRAQSPHGER